MAAPVKVSDQEFSRQVGITADLRPPMAAWPRLLLAIALLLAASTSLLAVMFAGSDPAARDDFQTGVTECPMTPPSR